MNNTLQAWMILKDGKATIAWLDVDGTEGKLLAKDITGRGHVNIFLKVGNEKRIKLFSLPDSYRLGHLRDALPEYININYVTRWAPELTLEPHV